REGDLRQQMLQGIDLAKNQPASAENDPARASRAPSEELENNGQDPRPPLTSHDPDPDLGRDRTSEKPRNHASGQGWSGVEEAVVPDFPDNDFEPFPENDVDDELPF